MSDINKKRAFVYDMYPSKGWHKRVNGMSDAQVLAIYLRAQNKGREEEKDKENSDGDDPIPF